MLFSQVRALTTILATFDCQLTYENNKFDLTSLAGVHSFDITTPTPPTVTKTTYSVSLCSALPSPPTNPEDSCPVGTRICAVTTNQRSGLDDRIISVIPLASETGDMQASIHLVSGESNTDKSWVLHLGGGEWNSVRQAAMIEMVCDSNAKPLTAPTFVSYDAKGLLNLKWVTIAACSTTSSTPPPTDREKTPEKNPETPINPPVIDTNWGFFSWFFTLFFLTLIIYFVGGTYYNYSQFGIIEIPHQEVWKDLPYLAADLFKGRGGSRNGYNSLG